MSPPPCANLNTAQSPLTRKVQAASAQPSHPNLTDLLQSNVYLFHIRSGEFPLHTQILKPGTLAIARPHPPTYFKQHYHGRVAPNWPVGDGYIVNFADSATFSMLVLSACGDLKINYSVKQNVPLRFFPPLPYLKNIYIKHELSTSYHTSHWVNLFSPTRQHSGDTPLLRAPNSLLVRVERIIIILAPTLFPRTSDNSV